MASSVEKELAKHLECGICLEKFEDPKVLRCQHLYCKKCLERLVTENTILCPECRTKTEVPFGGVTELPSNFLINNLLSIRGNCQTDASSSCTKHDGEILKLFCCNVLICRDCALKDHRNHEYRYVKEIFPVVKREILDIVQKSRENIRALESSIETINKQKDDMHKNFVKEDLEIDRFIDKEIELLERKRKSMKDDLQQSISDQKKILDAEMESFQTSLGRLKSSVEFTEETLTRGSEVEILSAKNQMIQQLTELNSATSDLKRREGNYNHSEMTDLPTINLAALKTTAKKRKYDEEYELLIKYPWGTTLSKDLRTFREPFCDLPEERFCIRSKSESSALNLNSKVQVTIIAPDSEKVQVPVTYDPDHSFRFRYKPDRYGDYKIKVLINGRFIYGSPFTWKVGDVRRFSK